MGLDRTFRGQFKIQPPLKPAHAAYLRRFSRTRRVTWDTAALDHAADPDDVADPLREAVGLPLGTEGAYYVGHHDRLTGRDFEVLDCARPPAGQPGLWCQWSPNEMGNAIVWDGGDKFYAFKEWLRYLIEHFLTPWGYVLNGKVYYEAEEHQWSHKLQDVITVTEYGTLIVRDNVVERKILKRPRRG